MEPNVPTIIGTQEYEETYIHFKRLAEEMGALPLVQIMDTTKEAEIQRNFITPGSNPHRIRHTTTAVHAIRKVLGDRYNEDKTQEGLKHLRWPGRFERLPNFFGPGSEVLCDAAHNSDGLRVLMDKVKELQTADNPFIPERIIFSCMKDKDIPTMITELRRLNIPLWGCQLEGNPRAASKEQLSIADRVLTVTELKELQPSGQSLICGSIYLLGDLVDAKQNMSIWV